MTSMERTSGPEGGSYEACFDYVSRNDPVERRDGVGNEPCPATVYKGMA
jgi:hypothetical protein